MAYGVLPPPGSALGPCTEPCTHRDCAASRRMAEHLCRYCGKPIGYDSPFVTDHADTDPEHTIHLGCGLPE